MHWQSAAFSGKAVDAAAPMRLEVVPGLQQAIDESPELWQSNLPLHTVAYSREM